MADELVLFELPAGDPPASRSRTDRGRAGQVYARTAVADVRVRRPEALHAEALRAFDESPKVVIGEADPDDDAESRETVASDWVAALGWLIDPSVELWPLIEAGAIWLLRVDIDLSDPTADECRLAWTVTVRLDDVEAFRGLAVAACPEDDTDAQAEIGVSLATAWRWAAEPYAPLRGIAGITWTPVEVRVEHRPARPTRATSA